MISLQFCYVFHGFPWFFHGFSLDVLRFQPLILVAEVQLLQGQSLDAKAEAEKSVDTQKMLEKHVGSPILTNVMLRSIC